MVSKISGIYAYYDNLKHEIVYVGKDSNIEKNRRHRDHYTPSLKNVQKINKILQNNNSGRYTYTVLEKDYFTDDELNQKEISWISYFNPRFNFTEGGDGTRGYKHSEEAREKMSEANKGKKLSEEIREKMSKAKKGENNPNYGKKPSEEAREKMSKAKKGKNNPQFSSCIKIRKQKNNCWVAQPYTPEKQKYFSSVNLQKCIEKVEDFLNSEENTYGYDSYEVVNNE